MDWFLPEQLLQQKAWLLLARKPLTPHTPETGAALPGIPVHLGVLGDHVVLGDLLAGLKTSYRGQRGLLPPISSREGHSHSAPALGLLMGSRDLVTE